jgi:hypothetical protein
MVVFLFGNAFIFSRIIREHAHDPHLLKRLRDIPGMQFRTDNGPFKREMERFMHKFVSLTEDLFWENGGPVIALQIENEYGNIEKDYGVPGHRYIEWAAQLTSMYVLCEMAKLLSMLKSHVVTIQIQHNTTLVHVPARQCIFSHQYLQWILL